MKSKKHQINNLEMLEVLFRESEAAYVDFQGSYEKSIYGTHQHLSEMSVYELAFSPYIELAKECGMGSISLRRSNKTGRIYLWNVNLGGHAPKLELRPVSLERVLDLAVMKTLHDNWAYLLGCNIDLEPGYEI
ncbi:hypothetical protein ACFOEK_17845 [Litoribrevibacter euphylliae]|uniref:Uncharacterized protein n=1 Tax=Litoribrevibacter euphylliae TaxID=1834034 RepID=A0ABV7HNJ9_9GAMM